jgi:3-isopropylmalate dehydrogenase
MKASITVLGGDGIGPEVAAEGVRCLSTVAQRFGHQFTLAHQPFGGAAIELTGAPLPQSTLDSCLASDAILLGAIGGPKWSAPDAQVRPESGLLGLRKALGTFANLRPVTIHPALRSASTLRAEVLEGVDLMFVRELTGGIYFGEKSRTATEAVDVCRYSSTEIERVVRLAANLARGRRKKLTSVDKANVLETSRLWRSTVNRIMPAEFPDISVEHMLVDSAAMHLLQRPRDFDVIVTENMFGDILTDEASLLAGSMGLLPSASLSDNPRGGVFEPIHGSAPDIAGRGIANPYAAILSAALLLRYSLRLNAEAQALERAVDRAISAGALTADLAVSGTAITTRAAADAVLAAL